MAEKKSQDSQIYNFDLEDQLSYRELLKAFNDMYADSINAFKKISFQKEMILKLGKYINDLNSSLSY